MEESKIYYAFDPVTKEFAGEVMLKNKTENMTESPPVREFNNSWAEIPLL